MTKKIKKDVAEKAAKVVVEKDEKQGKELESLKKRIKVLEEENSLLKVKETEHELALETKEKALRSMKLALKVAKEELAKARQPWYKKLFNS